MYCALHAPVRQLKSIGLQFSIICFGGGGGGVSKYVGKNDYN